MEHIFQTVSHSHSLICPCAIQRLEIIENKWYKYFFCRASSVFSILLLLLRDSSNYKIKIQAAVALAVPSSVLGEY